MVNKGKVVATVPQKRKGNLPPGPREKLMKDVFNARAGGEGPEAIVEPARGTGMGGRFVSS